VEAGSNWALLRNNFRRGKSNAESITGNEVGGGGAESDATVISGYSKNSAGEKEEKETSVERGISNTKMG